METCFRTPILLFLGELGELGGSISADSYHVFRAASLVEEPCPATRPRSLAPPRGEGGRVASAQLTSTTAGSLHGPGPFVPTARMCTNTSSPWAKPSAWISWELGKAPRGVHGPAAEAVETSSS